MKTPITCWNCDTEYDYNQHETCPLCEVHWLDANKKQEPPAPGTRVSVVINHDRKSLKTVPALLLVFTLIVAAAACTPRSCPTYSEVSKYPPELLADTTTVEKDRFSLAEKAGAVLFGLFVVYAVEQNKEENR